MTPSGPVAAAAPRVRGRPPSLNENEIVTVALRLTREVGLEKLSMRALARELSVPTMTIYHYVPNKDALRELVVNHILAEIRIPGSDEGSWEDRLRQVEREARRVLAEHPGVSAQLRLGGYAEGSRLAEGVLAILRDGGLSPEEAALCFAALYTFMTGQIDLDAMGDAIVGGPPGTSFDGVTRSTRFTRDQLFEFGFDALIEGLKIKLLHR